MEVLKNGCFIRAQTFQFFAPLVTLAYPSFVSISCALQLLFSAVQSDEAHDLGHQRGENISCSDTKTEVGILVCGGGHT